MADKSRPADVGAGPDKGAEPETDVGSGDAGSGSVRVVPGIARYHRHDCILIRFLTLDDLEIMTKEAATAGGCVPCKACQPDKSTAGVPVG